MADQGAVRTEEMMDPETTYHGVAVTEGGSEPAAESASHAEPLAAAAVAPSRWRPWGGRALVVRLALVAAAVAATMLHAGPALQAPLWLAAAIGVALVFRTEALDLLARSLGLGAVTVILIGPVLQAFGVKLWHDTWALSIGALAVAAIVVGHLRRPAGHPGPRPEDEPREAAPLNRRSLVWGGLAALTVVGALAGAGLSGRIDAPEAEMWLVNPAEAQATPRVTPGAPAQPGAGQAAAPGAAGEPGAAGAPAAAAPIKVQVAVRAEDSIPDAQLVVTPLGPFVAVPYAPATVAGGAPAAAPAPTPTFAVPAGQTVQRTVTVPATGRTEIRLTSASRPELSRTLVLNR